MNNMTGRRFFATRLFTAGCAAVTATAAAPSMAADPAAGSCTPKPAMSRERFLAYIDAFNKDDYTSFGDYYAEDVLLVIAGKRELRGRQAIFDFYKEVKSQTQRTIQVNKFIGTANRIAAELESEFLALEDLPNFTAGPMKKGGRIFINTFVIYDLVNGKFKQIRSAEFRKIDRQLTAPVKA
ncbi:MAG: nuclear transport factor 2 family protein [Steroidobacteraceae bacterium]